MEAVGSELRTSTKKKALAPPPVTLNDGMLPLVRRNSLYKRVLLSLARLLFCGAQLILDVQRCRPTLDIFYVELLTLDLDNAGQHPESDARTRQVAPTPALRAAHLRALPHTPAYQRLRSVGAGQIPSC